MVMGRLETRPSSLAPPAAPTWRMFLVAFAIGVLGTAALGGVLFHLWANVWWLALGGGLSLFTGCFYLGWRMRAPEPLYAALLAIASFGVMAAVLFGGELSETLPDPLPGLATGDSTFFFVVPLLMLTASVLGMLAGGKAATNPSRGG